MTTPRTGLISQTYRLSTVPPDYKDDAVEDGERAPLEQKAKSFMERFFSFGRQMKLWQFDNSFIKAAK